MTKENPMQNKRAQQLRRSLDWLKSAADIDDDYIQRWSPAEWEAWQAAMLADPHGANPSVPAWMNPIIHRSWHNDFSFPFPQVAQLITAHDWFREDHAREDFSLKIAEPLEGDSPVRSQLAAAYGEGLLREWQPIMSVLVEPTRKHQVVVGAIESFYFVAPAAASEDVADVMRHFDLPAPTTQFVGPVQSLDALLVNAGLPVPETAHVAWGSEWMFT